ncbi:hypothetical protein PAXRUDRAFT_835970 [Paxillus rubicundulus Ve08.2h10]|uniref:Uncharacterized protein n=1 Tax=Paxillus rubicundulus Ve08.2h10 TaxID=930991 RepID=A0A0D0CGT4_9AGAM|nr:hypothetical protein PAXRUDRAFT_835970 [Paxillus rubicundulus Ve08.2h10]
MSVALTRNGLTQCINVFNFTRCSRLHWHVTSPFTASPRHCSKTFLRLRSSASESHNATIGRGTLRGSGLRVSTLFTALLILGVGTTAVGLYEFYSMFTLWPKELRADLRAGIKARNQGDLSLSERYLARAYQTALSLSPLVLSPDPYLKLSGIAAVLAEVAPERRAKGVLQSVWDRGGTSKSPTSQPDGNETSLTADSSQPSWASYSLTNEECLRRVAVACKLAELCSKKSEEEEKWLVLGVEEVLRLAGAQTKVKPNAASQPMVLAELELPPWMRKVHLGAPLAALGALYARKGNAEYAMPLYLQAISLLLSPKMENISIEDRCQAAQLMNNLSELIMRHPPSPEIRHQAEAWVRQAYGVTERIRETPLPPKRWFSSGDQNSREVCNQVSGVVLFNLGMLREMDQDIPTARSLYARSLTQCEEVGMNEGVMQAKEALRRIGRRGTK